jgi:starch synthase
MKSDFSWKRSAAEYMGLYSLITGIGQSRERKALENFPVPEPLSRPIDTLEKIPVKRKPPAKKGGSKGK